MEEIKVIEIICQNCHTLCYGYYVAGDKTKITCRKCGAVTITQIMSRRHINYELYAPKGQIFIGRIK